MKLQDIALIIFVCLLSMYGYMFLKHYSIRTEVELAKLEAITQIAENLGDLVEMRSLQAQLNSERKNSMLDGKMD